MCTNRAVLHFKLPATHTKTTRQITIMINALTHLPISRLTRYIILNHALSHIAVFNIKDFLITVSDPNEPASQLLSYHLINNLDSVLN